MTTAVISNKHDLILAGPVGSLDVYIHGVNQVPVLSQQEEQVLARRFRDEAGLMHQRIAAIAGAVVLVTAGLPQNLK